MADKDKPEPITDDEAKEAEPVSRSVATTCLREGDADDGIGPAGKRPRR